MLYSSQRGVINKVIGNALKGKTITVYGSGNYLRDYIHISDVVRYIKCSIENKNRLSGKHTFLCYGKSYSINEVWNLIAKLIWDLYSIKVTVKKNNWPKNLLEIEKRNFVADNSMLINDFKIKPSNGLNRGLTNNIKMIHNILNN